MFGPKRINHLRGEAHLKEAIGLVEDHVLDTGQTELVRGRGRGRARARGTAVGLGYGLNLALLLTPYPNPKA